MTIKDINIFANNTLEEIIKLYNEVAPYLRPNKVFISNNEGVYMNHTVFPNSEVMEEYVRRCAPGTINTSPLLHTIHCKMMTNKEKVMPTNSELLIESKGITFYYRATKDEIKEVFNRLYDANYTDNKVFISEEGVYYNGASVTRNISDENALLEWAKASMWLNLPKELEKSALLNKLCKELETPIKSECPLESSTSLLILCKK